MDKQSVIGFVVIGLIFMAWMYYTSEQSTNQKLDSSKRTEQKHDTIQGADSVHEKVVAQASKTTEKIEQGPQSDTDDRDAENKYGRIFAAKSSGVEKTFTVETGKYIAEFSTRGGGLKRWILKGFSTWNKKPLQLIDWNIPSDLNLFFLSTEGKQIKTENLFFDFPDFPGNGKVVLADSESYKINAVLSLRGDSSRIVKTFVLKGGRYSFDVDVRMKNMQDIISNYEYQITINTPALTEQNSVEEASFAEADAYVNDNRVRLDVSNIGQFERKSYDGDTHWASIHNKYFINALICREGFLASGVYMEGRHIPLPNNGSREIYQVSMKVRYRDTPNEVATFTQFIGPMKYELLKNQHAGLEQVLNLGWAWVVRPFSEYLIIPLFTFLHSFIPNYGIVIILFTIIIKLLLYPLTKSSMQSMRKMQLLQPMMEEIRTKYKDDQNRVNTETMKLYKDYGINPAGGCLPMILQMPILFALFTIFRSTIELRQQPFVLWITDLSAPDILFRLPFTIPILNTNFISILALIMAVTMFIQQIQTVKDPRQKMMIYIMPVMFWIMFNGFPSGLNLYYFVFNLLSIVQQWYMNKHTGGLELKKSDKKSRKGWMERAMESLEQKAKQQQKSIR